MTVTRQGKTTLGNVAGLAVVGLGVLAILTGCAPDKWNEPFNDAQRSGVENQQPMDVVTMSDGFSNVGTKCDHGNRVYVAYHGDNRYAALAVVPNDPTCKGR